MILDKQLIFIIGASRSGTSWLQMMLGAHPLVCTTNELTLYDIYTAPWIKAWKGETANIERRGVPRGLPFLWTEDEFYGFLREFLNRVYERVLATKPQATHILDKNPRYSEHVEEINKLLPHARFIHMIRDGRDVAVSLKAARQQMGWFGDDWLTFTSIDALWSDPARRRDFVTWRGDFVSYDPLTIADVFALWEKLVRAAQKARQYHGRYLEVKYEDLSTAPVDTLKSVFDFCGLSASVEDVAEIVHAHQFEKIKASRVMPARNVTAPEGHYRKGKVGNWREELDPKQKYLFDEIAGDLLCELGYAENRWWWAESRLEKVTLPVLAAISSRKRVRKRITSVVNFLIRALHVRTKKFSRHIGRLLVRAQNNVSSFPEDAPVIFENYFVKKPKDRLIILDDLFPHLLSAFRVAEYNAYLETFANAEIHSTVSALRFLGEQSSFREVLDEYAQYYPQFRNRIFKFNPKRKMQGKLIYTVFLNNAFSFIDVIEKYNVPFIFTLYPGGGFLLNQARSDNKLRKICASPNLKKIITTQKISYEYLMDGKFCEPEKVEFIYGAVVPSERLTKQMMPRRYYQKDKGTFDICFVAYKYTERGIDKGYDVFIEVAKLLLKTHKDIFFHVVGSFDASDIDVSDIKNRITFYGTRHTDFFPEFYSRMDIILSPNVPFTYNQRWFDGFPTGACMEAGLCGVAVFCTDILGQNIAFKDGKEIVIIPRDVEETCEMIDKYYDSYDDLWKLGRKGQEAFRRVFDIEAQMGPRLRILAKCMDSYGPCS